MDEYTYLIIGGGMTADAAVSGIREIDMSGRIGIISQEEHPPYDRPPLTKGLWFGTPFGSIWRKTERQNVILHLGKTVAKIDPVARTVTDSLGNVFHYQKLLLATGGTPRHLNCPDEGVLYYRTLNDYYTLRHLYERGEDFVLIGGGFITTELAAALTMNGKQVTLVVKEKSLSASKLPPNFSRFLDSYFTEQGVRLILNQTVDSISKQDGKYQIKTSGNETLQADGVVAGLGIKPNTLLARALGLTIEDGITVNSHLQTSQSGIWAAGDVANFYNPDLGKRIRVEHEDNANAMGKAAGRNMAGANEPYTYLPYFYSDLFELGYEAIGEISSDMEIVENWDEPYRQGTLYYLKEGLLRGAMMWNVWHQVPRIRELIASKQPFSMNAIKLSQ